MHYLKTLWARLTGNYFTAIVLALPFMAYAYLRSTCERLSASLCRTVSRFRDTLALQAALTLQWLLGLLESSTAVVRRAIVRSYVAYAIFLFVGTLVALLWDLGKALWSELRSVGLAETAQFFRYSTWRKYSSAFRDRV